jgi:hypothetical protein
MAFSIRTLQIWFRLRVMLSPDQFNCCADPDRMASGCGANETTSLVDYSLPASFPRSQCDSAMGSDHPSFSVQQLGEGSPSCREDSEKGEGIADFARALELRFLPRLF